MFDAAACSTIDETGESLIRVFLVRFATRQFCFLSGAAYIAERATYANVANILKKPGIEPCSRRNRQTNWKEFLSHQLGTAGRG